MTAPAAISQTAERISLTGGRLRPVPVPGLVVSNNDRSQQASPPALRAVPSVPPSAAAVSDDIELLAHAGQALAVELDLIAASSTPVCATTVDRLEDLLEVVRDGARVRGQLQQLQPELLRTAAQLWLARRDAPPTGLTDPKTSGTG